MQDSTSESASAALQMQIPQITHRPINTNPKCLCLVQFCNCSFCIGNLHMPISVRGLDAISLHLFGGETTRQAAGWGDAANVSNFVVILKIIKRKVCNVYMFIYIYINIVNVCIFIYIYIIWYMRISYNCTDPFISFYKYACSWM